MGENKEDILETKENTTLEVEEKKKGKVPFILGCIAVGIVVLGVATFASPSIVNIWRRMFSSPEDYYTYILRKYVDSSSEELKKAYQLGVDNWKAASNATQGAEYSLSISDEAKSAIMMYTDGETDISWLDSLSFKMTTTMQDRQIYADANMLLNDENIQNIGIYVNEEEVQYYLPDLSDTGLGILFTTLGFREGDTPLGNMFDALEDMPEGDVLESIYKKYAYIILEGDKEVSHTKESLSVEDVSQNVYSYEAIYDHEDLDALSEKILTMVVSDEELKEAFIDYYTAAISISGLETSFMMTIGGEYDAEGLYTDFISSVQALLDDKTYVADENKQIVLKISVSGSGNIVGIDFRNIDVDTTTRFIVKTPVKGSKKGYAYTIERTGSDTLHVEGVADISASTITGDFTFYSNDLPIADIVVNELNTLDYLLGKLKGDMTIAFSPSAWDSVNFGFDLSSYPLHIVFNIDGVKDTNYDIELLQGEKAFVTMHASTQITGEGKIEKPDYDVIYIDGDGNGIEEWTQTIDFKQFITKLRDSDIPSEWLDTLEMYSSYIFY